MSAMVDWPFASRLAGTIAGEPPHAPLGNDLAELAADSERRVRAYTGLDPSSPLPGPESVTRKQWIDANVSGMKDLVEPLSGKLNESLSGLGPLSGPAQIASGYVLAGEIGVLFGFLGQYELALLDPTTTPRLLFVAPNLDAAQRHFDVDRREFLHWVALHEVTHALQFSAVPWLRGHLASQVRELIAGLDVSVDLKGALKMPDGADIKKTIETLREGDLLSVMTTPEQRAIIDRVQAAMAVIEGYAEHVMDEAGRDALPSLDKLREALERRRRQSSPIAKILNRLLGMELKMRQYEIGKRFCDAVVNAEGIAALNRVWDSPEALPSLAELDDPESWITRTREPVPTG